MKKNLLFIIVVFASSICCHAQNDTSKHIFRKITNGVINKATSNTGEVILNQLGSLTISGNVYSDNHLVQLLERADDKTIKVYIESLTFEQKVEIQEATENYITAYYSNGGGTGTDDNDADGVRAVEKGGNDCNDNNPFVSPRNHEQCQGSITTTLQGKRIVWINSVADEDCDLCTVATRGFQADGDEDLDGAISCNCANLASREAAGRSLSSTCLAHLTSAGDSTLNPYFKWQDLVLSEYYKANGIHYPIVRGVDCDDNNPAIGKNGQKCIGENKVGMCVQGVWQVMDCKKCVTQPNGTGLVTEW